MMPGQVCKLRTITFDRLYVKCIYEHRRQNASSAVHVISYPASGSQTGVLALESLNVNKLVEGRNSTLTLWLRDQVTLSLYYHTCL